MKGFLQQEALRFSADQLPYLHIEVYFDISWVKYTTYVKICSAISGEIDKSKMKNPGERLPDEERLKPVREQMKTVDSLMTAVEQTLYQTKNRSGQDPLNFPVRLNDKLGNLMELAADGDFPPTDPMRQVRDELFTKIDLELSKWRRVQERELPVVNRLVRELGVEVIRVKEE